MQAGDDNKHTGRKAVVFLSSCDGVEFHYEILVKASADVALKEGCCTLSTHYCSGSRFSSFRSK